MGSRENYVTLSSSLGNSSEIEDINSELNFKAINEKVSAILSDPEKRDKHSRYISYISDITRDRNLWEDNKDLIAILSNIETVNLFKDQNWICNDETRKLSLFLRKTIKFFNLKSLSNYDNLNFEELVIRIIDIIDKIIKTNKSVNGDELILSKLDSIKKDFEVLLNKIKLYKAKKDPLTWLDNRTSHNEKLLNLEKDQNYTYITIDIDFFKRVNDKYKHDWWDIVLKTLSSKLKEKFRRFDSSNDIKNNRRSNNWNDIIARFWWEEFVICTSMSINEAKTRLKEVRDEIDWKEYWIEELITFSWWMAEYKWDYLSNHENAEIALKEVDDLLYRAKKAWRNRIFSKGQNIKWKVFHYISYHINRLRNI